MLDMGRSIKTPYFVSGYQLNITAPNRYFWSVGSTLTQEGHNGRRSLEQQIIITRQSGQGGKK
jgi:hypothetical protein